ncbi:MAG: PrsW family intramembrane metalloprotease [Ruminiclostridium sp.]|nr:PrsW family intramembrane metalloprotease [Ruminiclostridium sp.]
MFYYLFEPVLTYHFILVAAAVIPAVFLMIKVYRSDRLEKESPRLLMNLVKAGVLSSLLALVEERVLSVLLVMCVAPDDPMYNIILYFGIVAFSEETSKYIFMKRNTWRNYEFNCQYDGVVYAVFVSLGFALWENISYVLQYGFATAVVRAGTAIPGHACFGVFMGVFYGIAKKYDNRGDKGISKLFRVLAVLFPAALHGAYDYIATMEEYNGDTYFIGFIVVLFAASYILVNRMSKNDRYI